MSLANCIRCGKLFLNESHGADICKQCLAETEDEFRIVKELIRKHPGISVTQIEEISGISSRKILKWVREGRIHLS